MSLMVWLPLNGDLKNQGLANVTASVSGATVNSSGKIGSCYSFDGSDDYISLTSDAINNCFKGGSQQFSIAFWIYRADATRGIVFGDYGLTNAINFNLEFNTSHQFRFYWAGSPDKVFSTAAVTASAWNHAVFTYNGTTLKYYLNGTLKETYAVTLGTKTKTSGAAWYLGRDSRTGTTALNGRLNDFRLYDHCLSAKEVKEISKGLVLHYPLNNGGCGGENLATNTDLNTAWGWSLQTGDTIKTYEDSWCVLTKGTTTTASGWSYAYYNGGIGRNNYIASTKYTISFDLWSNVSGSVNIDLRQGNSTNPLDTGFVTCSYAANTINKIKVTITTLATLPSSTTQLLYISGFNTTNGNIYKVRNLKIELGDKATPWCPNSADALYTSWGMDSLIEYDCSGYSRNGTITGTLTSNADSAKYSSCLYWPTATAANNYIHSPTINLSGDAITLNIWFKSIATGGAGYQMALTSSSRAYCELSITSGGALRAGLYVGGTRYVANCSNPTILDGKWHMLTITYDGTTIRRYVDAVAYATTSTTGTLNATAQSYYVGVLGGDTAYWASNAYMSDARIYTTALSADDIKELYQIPIAVDKSGNAFASEFIEDQKPEFEKTGIMENSYIHENEADDSDSLTTFHIGKTKTFANQIIEV